MCVDWRHRRSAADTTRCIRCETQDAYGLEPPRGSARFGYAQARVRAQVTEVADPPDRQRRRAAARSRQRILHATRKLVSAHGLDVSYAQIAKEAGVTARTVYRHYPRRTELHEAVFVDRVDSIATLAEAALAYNDARQGLNLFLAGVFELQAEDRGLREFMTRGGGADLAARMSIQPAVSELVRRAHDSGALRSDIGVGDIPLIPMMVGAVINGADDVSPDCCGAYSPSSWTGSRRTRPPRPLRPSLRHLRPFYAHATALTGLPLSPGKSSGRAANCTRRPRRASKLARPSIM